MKKKYHITDADGSEYEVEEIMEDEDEVIEETVEEPEVHDESLSEEEIAALRGLAAVADKLMALVNTSDACDEDEDDVCDEDEELVEEREEEVIDTDSEEEEQKPRDSKKSIGALEKRKAHADDSLVDEIANAWAKRYGGTK